MSDEPLAEETQKAKAQFDELTAIRKIINIFEKFDERAQFRIQSYVQHYFDGFYAARADMQGAYDLPPQDHQVEITTADLKIHGRGITESGFGASS